MEPRDDLRPLTARSVVASTLLGVRPPRLPVRALVTAAARFGIAEGTVRTALSRMVAAGELTRDGAAYELAGPLRTRGQRQDESRAGATRPWDGEWQLAVVDIERRDPTDRAELRAATRALRLAELREGVWLRPDNLDPARLPEARAVVASQCRLLASRPEDDAAELAARLWDLDGWSGTAERLRADLADHERRLAAGEPAALAPGFVLSASVLRHFQADPLLPADLLPPGWPGPVLRAAYEAYDAIFQAAWRAVA
jgi:phenylacetic acid degradation operon negative regulatory protein